MHRRRGDASGFTLVETLVAATLVVVAVFGLVELFVMSVRATTRARDSTFAVVLAAEKIEQLRALTWGFDLAGLSVSDTTTDISVFPERPAGGAGLSPSPSGSLFTNTQGYHDFLDARGRSLAPGASPPSGTAYIRRWAIDPLPADPAGGIVLQVLVVERTAASTVQGGRGRSPAEARLLTVKTRKAG